MGLRGPLYTRGQSVYILSVSPGYYKIGRANNPNQRGRDIQCGNHELLRPYHVRGEWFNVSYETLVKAWKQTWYELQFPAVVERWKRGLRWRETMFQQRYLGDAFTG